MNSRPRVKIFFKIFVWSLLSSLVFGIGLSVLIGLLTGLFKQPDGGDDMAQGLVFAFMLLAIGNIASYVVAILAGRRYVRRQGLAEKPYLGKVVPISVIAFFATAFLAPLLLFGNIIAALIAVYSMPTQLPVRKHLQSQVPQP